MTPADRPLYVMGDVHGQAAALLRLLYNAGLINAAQQWTGGASRLWFMGDFFDRGPGSLAAVSLIMRLQEQAAAAGGEVGALLGNHEVLFLAAHQFAQHADHGLEMRMLWLTNGGLPDDLTAITPAQIAWLQNLPALARVDDWLFMHADAVFYTHYGDSVTEVNARIHGILTGYHADLWDRLLDQFSARMMFLPGRTDGAGRAQHILSIYGGRQIVHGHTPIHYLTGQDTAENIHEAYPYARRNEAYLCLNVDGGLYAGGAGFIHRLK